MKIVAFVLIFGFASLCAFSCGNDAIVENTAKIIGSVRIYGNEPFTFVGILDENGTQYAVYPRAKEDELRMLQGHLIEFTVIFLDEPMGEGGMYLKGGTVTPVSWEIIR